jgi:hypothetical protein
MPPRILFDVLDHLKCFSTGYWLNLQEPAGPVRHPFCGVHEIRGAHCFHGDHPVLRFLSLDTSDSLLGLHDLGWERDNDNELPETLDHPRHQVGGLPYLSQGSSYVPTCGDCLQPMAFVASVADDCGDPRGFTSNEHVQVVFFVCSACQLVHATNMVD